jgi:hypothetical protein
MAWSLFALRHTHAEAQVCPHVLRTITRKTVQKLCFFVNLITSLNCA